MKTPAAPELEFVVQLHVLLGQAYSVGKTTHGTRTIIPITGVTIHVRNNGIINMGKDGMYFTCAPRFEAPADSKYSWLNNKLFVCRPDFSGTGGGITLNVWMIK